MITLLTSKQFAKRLKDSIYNVHSWRDVMIIMISNTRDLYGTKQTINNHKNTKLNKYIGHII